jgi:hypothetical protein
MNYLAWTANLGVVPLLRLAAFLLAPIAFFFALRRFSVTAVLEAINISLNDSQLISKLKTLTIRLLFVKAIVIACGAKTYSNEVQDIIMAKGEQKELILENVKNFSVGNKDVISFKFNSRKNTLLIKGKQIGFSDLIIWSKKKQIKYSIYVLSKEKLLKSYQIAETLKNLNLQIDIKGPVMNVSGGVGPINDYLYLHQIKRQYPGHLFFKVTLTSELKNLIVGKIYEELYNLGLKKFSCKNDGLEIDCFYEGKTDGKYLKQLEELYFVKLIEKESSLKRKNYLLKLKLFQLERTDGQELQFGLDQIQAKVEDFFQLDVKKIIQDNFVFLKEENTELSTLAEPEIIVNLNHEQTIEIGSEIPFQNLDTRNQQVISTTDWKFAGLKIKTKIDEFGGKIKITYETEFTRPSEGAISGSREKSSLIISPGENVKVFKIGFQTLGKNSRGIPLLNKIPILKYLFESKSDQQTYKEIYGYLKFEEFKK